MKFKKTLIYLAVILASMCLFAFSNNVNAYTISENGKYTLIMNTTDGEIDGLPTKMVKFDFDEGETIVKLSDLTKDVVPFNGRTMFSHWGTSMSDSDSTVVKEELTESDFSSSGTSSSIDYTNGLVIWAKFSDKKLAGTGTYYLTIDPFAGKVNNQDIIKLTSKASEFKTVDLSKYVPVRKGCTFVGWGYNGKFVTSIDASYFKDGDVVEITAVYKKDTFEEDDGFVLNLDANGGQIDGKTSNKYNYLGGADSGTSMSIFQYVPERAGYVFKGWNSKKDGSGKNYKYMYWRSWSADGGTEFVRDTMIESKNMYKNLTLYAMWTKVDSGSEDVKEIESSSNTKGSIKFEDGINSSFVLDIKKIEVKKELADKNVKFIADINILDGSTVVSVNNIKMEIKIALPDELKGFDTYQVVYIKDGEIKETINARVQDGYIFFETTHLSEYGIIATNNKVSNPNTGDNMFAYVTLFVASAVGMGIVFISSKKRI